MKSYDELKAELKSLQKQMIEAKKNALKNALKEKKHQFNECGFNTRMLNGLLAKGIEKK
mgnify:CR=1 FL=1